LNVPSLAGAVNPELVVLKVEDDLERTVGEDLLSWIWRDITLIAPEIVDELPERLSWTVRGEQQR
jgi:hypothetical protein